MPFPRAREPGSDTGQLDCHFEGSEWITEILINKHRYKQIEKAAEEQRNMKRKKN
jgi:hypothetical protein